MTRDNEFRLFAAVLSGGVAVALFGFTMLLVGARPLPVSFVIAIGAGSGFGWWHTTRMFRYHDHQARTMSSHTPARSKEDQ